MKIYILQENIHSNILSFIFQIFMFTLTEEEMQKKQFNLRYSCATDTYERYVKGLEKIHIHSLSEMPRDLKTKNYI